MDILTRMAARLGGFATSGDLWSALGAVALVALAVHFVAALVRRRPPRLRTVLALALAAVAGAAGTFAFAPHPEDALVAGSGVSLTVSPLDGAEPVGPLARGEPVRVENTHDAFAYVRTPDGRSGWVPRAALHRYLGSWEE
jgi:hypothetical protein